MANLKCVVCGANFRARSLSVTGKVKCPKCGSAFLPVRLPGQSLPAEVAPKARPEDADLESIPKRAKSKRRRRRRLPSMGTVVSVLFLIAAFSGLGTFVYLTIYDWDARNASSLIELGRQADQLVQSGQFERASESYQTIIQTIGDRQVRDPKLIQLVDEARKGMEETRLIASVLEGDGSMVHLIERAERLIEAKEYSEGAKQLEMAISVGQRFAEHVDPIAVLVRSAQDRLDQVKVDWGDHVSKTTSQQLANVESALRDKKIDEASKALDELEGFFDSAPKDRTDPKVRQRLDDAIALSERLREERRLTHATEMREREMARRRAEATARAKMLAEEQRKEAERLRQARLVELGIDDVVVSNEKAEQLWRIFSAKCERFYFEIDGRYYSNTLYAPGTHTMRQRNPVRFKSKRTFKRKVGTRVLTEGIRITKDIYHTLEFELPSDELWARTKPMSQLAVDSYGFIHSGKLEKLNGEEGYRLSDMWLVDPSADTDMAAEFNSNDLAEKMYRRLRQTGERQKVTTWSMPNRVELENLEGDIIRWRYEERMKLLARQRRSSGFEVRLLKLGTHPRITGGRWNAKNTPIAIAADEEGSLVAVPVPALRDTVGVAKFEDVLHSRRLDRELFIRLASQAERNHRQGSPVELDLVRRIEGRD